MLDYVDQVEAAFSYAQPVYGPHPPTSLPYDKSILGAPPDSPMYTPESIQLSSDGLGNGSQGDHILQLDSAGGFVTPPRRLS
jgi:hypothetical protein